LPAAVENAAISAITLNGSIRVSLTKKERILLKRRWRRWRRRQRVRIIIPWGSKDGR
jgi:hypothetical protein